VSNGGGEKRGHMAMNNSFAWQEVAVSRKRDTHRLVSLTTYSIVKPTLAVTSLVCVSVCHDNSKIVPVGIRLNVVALPTCGGKQPMVA
jgi:hypothetical protein